RTGACRAGTARPALYVVPRLYEVGVSPPRRRLDEVWGIPLVPMRPAAYGTVARAAKRAFDLVVGAVLLVASAPLLGLLMAAVRLSDGRPVLIRQTRVTGPGSRTARIVKLRTVVGDADTDTLWAVPAERRTRLGGALRATHLDE